MGDTEATEGRAPLCGARKRQTEGTCRHSAGWGTDHVGTGFCRLHGGNTRTHRKAAADAQVDAQARAVLAQLDVQPCEDPLAELQMLAGQILAWRDAIGGMVREMSDLRYESDHGEQLRAEVALFERALDRCERVLVSMARLDLDARLVRLSEARGRLVAEVVLGVFADIGLSAELQAAARSAIAARLRAAAAEVRQQDRPPLALPMSRREG